MTTAPDTTADTPASLRLSLIRLRGEVHEIIDVLVPNVATALTDKVMTAAVAPAVEGLWKACDRYVDVIGTWQDEVNRLTDGADNTPRVEGEPLTAGQFFHQLLAAPAEGRRMMLENLGGLATTGRHCETQDHVGNIEDLMKRPTLHAFDTVCGSVERQRVALVAVLGLDGDTSFHEAVDAAGVLAGQAGEQQ